LFLVKNRNIALAKSPLLAFFEGRENVFPGKFIDSVRTHIENHGDLFAVEQFFFSIHHRLSLQKTPVGKKFVLSNKFIWGCQGKNCLTARELKTAVKGRTLADFSHCVRRLWLGKSVRAAVACDCGELPLALRWFSSLRSRRGGQPPEAMKRVSAWT
jgi:hypothetical protein